MIISFRGMYCSQHFMTDKTTTLMTPNTNSEYQPSKDFTRMSTRTLMTLTSILRLSLLLSLRILFHVKKYGSTDIFQLR